jgi:hypothetical protein
MAGPDAYSVMCTKAADGMRQAGASGESEEWRFDWDRPHTRDEWLEVVPTFGGYSQYPPAAQQELLAGIGAAIDAVGGRFTMGYTAVVATGLRSGAALTRTRLPCAGRKQSRCRQMLVSRRECVGSIWTPGRADLRFPSRACA